MTSADDSRVIRRQVVYSGRVQGVFFRATTVDLSRAFSVVGHVRNLRDGTVELEVEGSPEQVAGLLAAVAQHFRGNIADTMITELSTRGDENAFRVSY